VRSALVLRHLASALGSLPDLGTDPLDGLFEYDQRRNAALATTLRVWLNSFGDTPSATAVLGIHPNTLRYRLRRITEILGVDVRLDVAARIAIHLQLVARDTTQGV
jgi:DNA-binding PucR family transcriptional regulator